MKRILSSLLALAMLCGCATFERNANSAIGAMDIAVTIATGVWDVYVANGNATPQQVGYVTHALATYQKAKKVFADAMAVYDKDQNDANKGPVEIALDTLNYAAIDIVQLVLEFVPGATQQVQVKNARTMLPAKLKL